MNATPCDEKPTGVTDFRLWQPITRPTCAGVSRTKNGVFRAVRNPCLRALIEAVRDRTKTVDLKQVNALLIKPIGVTTPVTEALQPVVCTHQKSKNDCHLTASPTVFASR